MIMPCHHTRPLGLLTLLLALGLAACTPTTPATDLTLPPSPLV